MQSLTTMQGVWCLVHLLLLRPSSGFLPWQLLQQGRMVSQERASSPVRATTAVPFQEPAREMRFPPLHLGVRRSMRSPSVLAPLSRIAESSSAVDSYSVWAEQESLDENDDNVLSYLPDQGESLPPLTKVLLKEATLNYVYGDRRKRKVAEIAQIIEKEYKSVDVPVLIGNATADVTSTGEELDETMAEILSLAALHRVPGEITWELLDMGRLSHSQNETMDDSEVSFTTCQAAFAERGWDAVFFPEGLAVKPKREYRPVLEQNYDFGKGSSRIGNLVKRKKRRAAVAAKAVVEANEVSPPPQRRQTREEFLKAVEAQFLAGTDPDKERGEEPSLFFPNSVPLSGISLRRLKRTASKKYSTLRKKGRAGFIAYCFFNFAYYTAGMLWWWPRFAPAVPLAASNSVFKICLRKFGKVFGYLYAASQLFKIPKLFTAVALAPLSERCLAFTKDKLRVSETIGTILLVGLLFAVWCGIVAVPILTEFAQLRKLVHLEELAHGLSSA